MSASGHDIPPRIVSLLPSATEMVCALGLEPCLVGITHCCDFPPEIRRKPRVVHAAIPVDTMSLAEVDASVSGHLQRGESLYTVDEALLRDLAPTLIVTQDLCQVCAPAGNEVSRALKSLKSEPRVLWMSPHSIADIQSNLMELGAATGRETEAKALVASGNERLRLVAGRVKGCATRPRVFCAEWVDPLYCSGHWVPEMVEIAGGTDVLGRKWRDSVRITWESLVDAAPDLVVVMSCGFDTEKTVEQARLFLAREGAGILPAVRNGRVFAVDAGYFSRPGPRVVEGTELLAHLMFPSLCPWSGPADAFRRVSD